MTDRLSDHFPVYEYERSQQAARLGLPNMMLTREREQARRFCLYMLEPFRVVVGAPINLSSGYRSEAVNRAVGGSPTSAHMTGCAVDINVIGFTPYQLCVMAHESGLPFDQIIHEYGGWCHLSQSTDPYTVPRRDLLTASLDASGETQWRRGILKL